MILFRDATEHDVDNLVRVINSAFLVEQFFIERDRTNSETVRTLMKKGKFILASEGPMLLACAYLELRGDHGYFGMLSVEPSHQRMGLGRKMIALAEKYFSEAGCKRSELKIVNVRTDLETLYRRLGYTETGTSRYDDPVPTKMPVHFIEMSKNL